jgi:hypothetical protein
MHVFTLSSGFFRSGFSYFSWQSLIRDWEPLLESIVRANTYTVNTADLGVIFQILHAVECFFNIHIFLTSVDICMCSILHFWLNRVTGTHARDFIVRFSRFLHHSIKDKAEVQTFKKFVKWSVKFSYIIGFSRIPRYRRKRTVSLRVFADNAQLCFALSAKSGSDRKLRISGRIWRSFSKMLIVLRFVSISVWKMQK